MAEVLHPDVVLIGDSDGKAKTTRQVMVGASKILRFFDGLQRIYPPGAFATARPFLVNGDVGLFIPKLPGAGGYRTLDAHLATFAIREGRIEAIYDMANPDKLTHVPPDSEPGTPPPK